jgi:hypothetical protein
MADGTSPTDSLRGRPLIEGLGSPIDGGIFRAPTQPGIIVDSKSFEGNKQFKYSVKVMQGANTWLMDVTRLAKEIMPIGKGEDYYGNLIVTDPVDLLSFAKQEGGEARATPNAQALLVALLVEEHVKATGKDKKVYVVKEGVDNHAVVVYVNSEGQEYRFDPTKGDKKFIKFNDLTGRKVAEENVIVVHAVGPKTAEATKLFSEDVGSVIDDFSNGKQRIRTVTRTNELRKAVYQDCSDVQTSNYETVLKYASTQKNKIGQSVLYYNPVRGGLSTVLGPDSKILLVYFDNENRLSKASFYDIGDDRKSLSDKASKGLLIGELRALSLLAKLNNKAGGSEFEINYVNNNPDDTAIMSSKAKEDLIESVPNFFKSNF